MPSFLSQKDYKTVDKRITKVVIYKQGGDKNGKVTIQSWNKR